MIKKLSKISLVAVLALAIVVGTGVGAAQAILTFGTTSVTGSTTLELLGATDSAVTIGAAAQTAAITIGDTAASILSAINIGTGNGVKTAINIGTGTGANGINIGTGITGVKTIKIGDAAAANVITMGSNTGAASLALKAGSGNMTLNATSGNVALSTTTSGTLTANSAGLLTLTGVGTGATSALAGIGLTAAAANTIVIGGPDQSALISIGDPANTANMQVNIASGTVMNSTVTIAGGVTAVTKTDTVNIATGNHAGTSGSKTVHIADGTPVAGAANVVTIGSAAGASSLALLAGTGDIAITSVDDLTLNGGSAGSLINIGTNTQGNIFHIGDDDTTADTIDLGSNKDTLALKATTFTLNGVAGSTYAIGAATTTGTITIGGTSGTGAISLGVSDGAQVLNIGNGAAANTIAIGGALSKTTIGGEAILTSATVASTTNMAITTSHVAVTGTATIVTITGGTSGQLLYLTFTEATVVTDTAWASTGAGKIHLNGAGNFTAAAGDTLTLILEGTAWREVSRAVVG